MKEMDDLSSRLIFEVEKAFYDERGKGARYRLTTIGVPFMNELNPNCFKDLDNAAKALVETSMAEKVAFTEDDFSITAEVNNCYFKKVRDLFTAANMQPLACPIANVIMETMERKSRLSPELAQIAIDGSVCRLTMVKMATSAVVKE
jgi:hypothetical protein